MPKSISQRASVESAKLEVKLAGGMMYSYVPENRLILYPITQKWKESEVSYNNASKDNGWEGYSFMGYLGATMVSAPIDTDMRVVSSDNEDVGSWVEFDVTDIVNKMIKNPDKYDGFIFAEGLVKNGDDLTSEGEHVYDTANSYNNQRYFFSSEHESVDDRPKLTINADVGVLNLGDIAAEKFAVTVNNNSVQLTNETQGDLSFALYDVRGRLVFTSELVKAGKVVTFTLPQTARGVYTLQAIGRESNFTKLIKL